MDPRLVLSQRVGSIIFVRPPPCRSWLQRRLVLAATHSPTRGHTKKIVERHALLAAVCPETSLEAINRYNEVNTHSIVTPQWQEPPPRHVWGNTDYEDPWPSADASSSRALLLRPFPPSRTVLSSNEVRDSNRPCRAVLRL